MANAVVGVFLRVLEYFNGLLFLTTNRIDDIDEAIVSRCIAGGVAGTAVRAVTCLSITAAVADTKKPAPRRHPDPANPIRNKYSRRAVRARALALAPARVVGVPVAPE